MKSISVLISLFFILQVTIGQTKQNDRTQFKNELGINVTPFIKNYINFSEDYYYYNSDYYLNYKRIHNNKAFRVSLGGTYSHSTDTGGYNSNTNFSSKGYAINTKLGYEFRNNINDRWMYYYGIDLVMHYNEYSSENLELSNGRPYDEGYILEYGGGPVLGIQLNLNERIAIATETNLYFYFSKQEEETFYPNNPDYNKQELRERTRVQYMPPMNVSINLMI